MQLHVWPCLGQTGISQPGNRGCESELVCARNHKSVINPSQDGRMSHQPWLLTNFGLRCVNVLELQIAAGVGNQDLPSSVGWKVPLNGILIPENKISLFAKLHIV